MHTLKPQHTRTNLNPFKISLTNLMQLYRDNYQKLAQLVDFNDLQKPINLHTDNIPISIEIKPIEHARYTITIQMNYHFNDSNDIDDLIPNATVRIYLDSTQAEVLAIRNHQQILSFFSLTHHEGLNNIEARWQLNQFLHKWLSYCMVNRYEVRP